MASGGRAPVGREDETLERGRTAVVWFKRDLRLHDHRPLVEAARDHRVIPLFIQEDDLWRRDGIGAATLEFGLGCAGNLDRELRSLGGRLVIRRGDAVEVLERLRNEVGASWEDVLVVGDIFELDLCLPLSMGARIGLVVNTFTPEYEKAFVGAHPRGVLIDSLSEIPGLL